MFSLIATAVVLALIAADIALVYWIATRTGLYGWADSQLGPPRRPTPAQLRFRKIGVWSLCGIMIGIPVQAALVIVAGIVAAMGGPI
jgi:hypothetical protein